MWTLWLIPVTSFGIAVAIFYRKLIREAPAWAPAAATRPGAFESPEPFAAPEEEAGDARPIAGDVNLDLDTDGGVAMLTERLRQVTNDLFLSAGRA